MAFCTKEKQLVAESYTMIANKFILQYMPEAPEGLSRVYLMGLALCNEDENVNAISFVAQKLGITCDEVLEAYYYWEEMGLVQVIASNPPQVIYLAMGEDKIRAVSSSKYAKFSKEIQKVITGRMIGVNEFNNYFDFLERHEGFTWEALIAVAKYCVDYKGNNINYPYILTVAKAQYQKGNCTAEAVVDNLAANTKYDADLKVLFAKLHVKRNFDYSDRELYEKWTEGFGYTLDTLCYVAKDCKVGGMKKLDALMCEYHKKGAFDVKEIASYVVNKQKLYELAKIVTKNLGVYYQSLDVVVDEYVCKWVRQGFDENTLTTLARYCFRNNVRTLSGLDNTVEKFYKMGITTTQAVDEYIQSVVATDKVIRSLLEKAGLTRNVTASDRKLYKTWTESWLMPADLVEYAIERCVDANNPLQYANKILSTYKSNGVTSVQQAQSVATVAFTPTTLAKTTKHSFEQHEYTDDEINALFTDLENLEI